MLRAKLLEEFPDRDPVWVELSEDYGQIKFRVEECTGKVGAGTALEPEAIEGIISGLRDLLG